MQNYLKALKGYQGIYLFGEKEQDLHRAIVNNIVGGPSIVFNRMVEVGTEGCPWKIILGHDANNLYPGTMLQEMQVWAGYCIPPCPIAGG
jgi:hypothetical protein